MVVQWLRIHLRIAGDTGSILGQGTKIPQAVGNEAGVVQIERPHAATRGA